MSLLPCGGCGAAIDCTNLDPFDLYSLGGDNFPFVSNCPPGYDCSATNELRMICCGQELVASFPPGATASQRLTVVSKMWQQCAVLLDFCAGLATSDGTPINAPDNPPEHEEPPNDPPGITQLYYSSPQSCTKVCPDSSTSAYATPAGLYLAATQELADSRAFAFACQQANLHVCPPCRTISLSSLPTSLCLSNAYSLNVVATGDTVNVPPGTNNWSLTGSLPPGTVFHGGTIPGNALLDGTPTTAGTYVFTVTVQVSSQCSKSKTYSVVVRGITTAARLDDAAPNEPYSQTLAATGFTGTLTWGIVSGSLPTGLGINSTTGEISGLPTDIGDFVVTIGVTDGTNTCSKEFQLSSFIYSGKRINAWKKWCGFTSLLNEYSPTSCDGTDPTCPLVPPSAVCSKRWLKMTVHQVWDNNYDHSVEGPGYVAGVDDTYVYQIGRYNCDTVIPVQETHLGQWIGDAYTQALNCTAPGCGICPTGCGIPNGGSVNPDSQLFRWRNVSVTENSFHVDIDFQVNLSEGIFHGSWDITLEDEYTKEMLEADLIALWDDVNPDDYGWEDGVIDIDATYRVAGQAKVQYCPTQPAVIPPSPKIRDQFASDFCNVNGINGQPLDPPLSSFDPYYDYLAGWLFAPNPGTCVNLVKTILRYRGEYCQRDYPKSLPVGNNLPSCDPAWGTETCLSQYSTALTPINILPITGTPPYDFAGGFRRILLDCALANYWMMEEASGNRVDAVGGVQLAEGTTGTGTIAQALGIENFGAQLNAPAPGGFIQSLTSAQITGLKYLQSGISMSGWFKWVTAPVFNDRLTFRLDLDGATQDVLLQINGGTSLAAVSNGVDTSFVNTPPFTPIIGQWHFFCLSYNRQTQLVSLSMDGAATVTAVVQADLTAGTNGLFSISFECGDPAINSQVVVDEVAIWESPLCPTVTAFLWNGSLGNFFPF